MVVSPLKWEGDSKTGLKKFGYAHFLPQHIFCEYNCEEIISRYFDLNNLSDLADYLKVRGIHFSVQKNYNSSQIDIQLNEDDIRFFESKCSVRATEATWKQLTVTFSGFLRYVGYVTMERIEVPQV